eukprot:TRINITY_DN6870_c0_g2_i1.p1 TRINITY_DN6870_c0_g2~~TRINITY_DN6870_c0_g2_i1.p1  ORF type:complete len:301 (-),score=36.63 TRINITY_DN6870_c0_g2_i1:58-960(-)
MRYKKTKQVKKNMTFYQMKFKFTPPYQLLLDAAFIHGSIQKKLNLEKSLTILLGGEVKLFTTKCVLHHLRLLGTEYQAAALYAKQLTKRKPCIGHSTIIDHKDCILSLLKNELHTTSTLETNSTDAKSKTTKKRKREEFENDQSSNKETKDQSTSSNTVEDKVDTEKDSNNQKNPHKKELFCVAAHDFDLKCQIRNIVGIPLIYLSNNVAMLEAVSKATNKHINQTSRMLKQPSLQEKTYLDKIKESKKTPEKTKRKAGQESKLAPPAKKGRYQEMPTTQLVVRGRPRNKKKKKGNKKRK